MGIDLKVFASSFRERRDEFLATATLRFDRDMGVLAQFAPDAQPCVVRLLPQGLKVGHYEDEGLKFAVTDRSGNPLTFTTPADLRRLRLPDDISPWNKAVLSFMLALPPETRLILYWC